jgi:uncharacterized protein with NRDE domain
LLGFAGRAIPEPAAGGFKIKMCVIFFAYQCHPEYQLILLANRDEFYDRPTAGAGFWRDAPEIYAGRDLVHGGTWLGITESGRFAAVTNYRDPLAERGTDSRSNLVGDFLKNAAPVEEYLDAIRRRAADFSVFTYSSESFRRKRERSAIIRIANTGSKYSLPAFTD